MNSISKNKTGLAVGSLFGVWHLMWAILVALGFAPRLLETIFRLHFIQPPFTIAPFDYMTAAELVGITFVVGYILGWLFGAIWNRLQ